MQTILDVKGLEIRRGGIEVIKDVNFTLSRGERVALLGENGIGKTSLLRVLAGLDMPVAGHIESPMALNLTNIGFMPEKPTTIPHVRVEEWLNFWAEQSGCAKPDRPGVEPLLKKPMHKLSYGQSRYVAWLAAMQHRPKLLLLDEPTHGLDVERRKILGEWLFRLSPEGATIFTTHDEAEANALATRIFRLVDGAMHEELVA